MSVDNNLQAGVSVNHSDTQVAGGLGLASGDSWQGQHPLKQQVGGSHYKSLAIQPVEYAMANGIGFMEGSVIKYVTRWRDKGGLADLRKARHFLDMLIANEEIAEEQQKAAQARMDALIGSPGRVVEGIYRNPPAVAIWRTEGQINEGRKKLEAYRRSLSGCKPEPTNPLAEAGIRDWAEQTRDGM